MSKAVFLLVLCTVEFSLAVLENKKVQLIPPTHLASNFNPSLYHIILIGSDTQKSQLRQWLGEIAQIKTGKQALLAIKNSGHQLTIKHSDEAYLSAGKTIAPMTENLINGQGSSVTIIFDASMPDYGTHYVYNDQIQLIEFNAIQNLYHELAHAMHKMQGTWRYFASEKQAIEEENRFRKAYAVEHQQEPQQRYGKSGVLIHQHYRKQRIGFND